MTRRIAVVTGTRAEYGLLRYVIHGLKQARDVELRVLATGMHLSPEFGLTYREIEADGVAIDERIEILLSSDTAVGVSKAVGLGVIGFAEALNRMKPNLLVLLGDRFELLAAATAALVAGVPIAHIHGGETTEGAFDEAIRHSVTKMAHLHFVAAEPYRDRVIQLGEQPDRVFLVGGLGVDAIHRLRLMDRAALERSLDFSFGDRSLLITFHPPTLEDADAVKQMQALLDALDSLGSSTQLLFTMPNADTHGREIRRLIETYVAARPHARAWDSLGQLRYYSALALVDGVVGNSSSGLAEAPSFQVGTVNVGDRQAGRLRADSIIDCAPSKGKIEAALGTLFSDAYRAKLKNVVNPYGAPGAADLIVQTLREHSLAGLLRKSFYDLPIATAPNAADRAIPGADDVS
jgi:UDP-hydrolysing UDP-N-acetyl-D-glucosamine 2-epimerase